MSFFFHITGDFIKLAVISAQAALSSGFAGIHLVTFQPVRYKIIAVCLMGKREEFVQPCQMFLEQRTGGCSQQQMDRKLTNIPILLAITGSLANHCPERIV